MSEETKALGLNSESEKAVAPVQDDELLGLQKKYEELWGERPANSYKNKIEWLKKKISEKELKTAINEPNAAHESKKNVETKNVPKLVGKYVLAQNIVHRGVIMKKGTDITGVDGADLEILKAYC